MEEENKVQEFDQFKRGIPIIDTRTLEEFTSYHIIGSSSFPWENLIDLVYELPPRGAELLLIVKETISTQTLEFFSEREYKIIGTFQDNKTFWERTKACDLLEVGNISKRLWKPCYFLEEMIETIEIELGKLNMERTGMDLACGTGRDVIFLATRGWKMTGVDNGEDKVAKVIQLAKRYNCSQSVNTLLLDLEPEDDEILSLGEKLPSVNLITVARYLHRPLFPLIKKLVRLQFLHFMKYKLLPGGIIVYNTFTSGVEAFGKPRRKRFILETGELKRVFSGYRILKYFEGPIEDGRPCQFLAAQKPLVEVEENINSNKSEI